MAIERARAQTYDVARLSELEQLRSEYPGDPRVRLALAGEYLAQGHEIEARTELASLLEIDPSPSARESLPPRLRALADELPGWATPDDQGAVLAELEQIRTLPNIADRIAGYRAATQRFPDDDRVWFNLATDLERAGDARGASEAMQQALMRNHRLSAHLPPEFRAPAEPALDPARELLRRRIELYTIERIAAVHESQILCDASVVSQDTRVILRLLTGIPAAQAKAMLQDELHVGRADQIVPVIDLVYDEQRRPYQVLEHFSGTSLSELRRPGVLPLDEKLETMCAVIEALGQLHERGLIHGDLRPEHVLRVSRAPLRIQFLGARGASGSERVLPPAQVAWAAPEEAIRVDERTDIYCFGLLLYHVFGDGSLPPLRERAATPLPAVGAETGSLSRIDKVIRTCTAIEPGQRYASCAEVLAALRGIVDEAEDLTGQVLGRYRLQRIVGRGGFGTVYQAEDLKLGGRAAVKVMRSALASSGEKRQRFFNEAHAASRVNHPNLIRMQDFDAERERRYIVMELLENGQTLGALIAQERLDVATVLTIAIQVASGLRALHQAKIIHRDVTPKNVYVTRDRTGYPLVKIFDLGIADIGGEPTPSGTPVTTYGERMGTPGYMAPEQYHMAPPVDARADVYGLGVVLYQCITGKPPFPEGHVRDWDEAYRDVEASPIEAAAPEELKRLVLQMLAVNRDNRPANMAEVEERLLRIQQELHASPPHRPEPPVPPPAPPPAPPRPEVATRPPEVTSPPPVVAPPPDTAVESRTPDLRAQAPERANARPKIDRLAIVSLVTGLMGLFWILSILSLVLIVISSLTC